MKQINLNGSWQITGVSPDGDRRLCLEGEVPGCVHTELWKQGKTEDPFCRYGQQSGQWIEDWIWAYRREFTAGEDMCAPESRLCFEGLDTYADIELNGVPLGSAENMFIPHTFPLDGRLREGRNTIAVTFRPVLSRTADCPERDAAFDYHRLYTRRMQCTYGWDWVPRLVACGIFRPCRVELPEPGDILELGGVCSRADAASAQLRVCVRVRPGEGETAARLTLLSPEGIPVRQETVRTAETEMMWTVDRPQLWYPNGCGGQPLYTLVAETATDRRSRRVGLRQLEIRQVPDAPGSAEERLSREIRQYPHLQGEKCADRNTQSAGFIVCVNGQPVLCKGACWVPSEPFPSMETAGKKQTLLELAADAGVNMLRVWGGGLLETEDFYRLCDEKGILIAQDFMMACGSYPDTPEFLEQVRRETEWFAQRLRFHTCLAWWNGDNENAIDFAADDPACWGRRITQDTIAPLLRRLDPDHPYFPSSPIGGAPNASVTMGTSHNTCFISRWLQEIRSMDSRDYREVFERYLYRFCAEEPTLGVPSYASLRRFMTEEEIRDEDGGAAWRFHTRNHPSAVFKTDQLHDYMVIAGHKVLGDPVSADDELFTRQYVQYEWVRLSMEKCRRRKWYTSGVLFWMFNDCWTTTSWALTDYYTLPKAGYYAFKNTAQPLIASLEPLDGGCRVYLCNDSPREIHARVHLYRYDVVAGREVKGMDLVGSCPANTTRSLFTWAAEQTGTGTAEDTVLLCDVYYEDRFYRTFLAEQGLAALPAGQAQVHLRREEDSVVLRADGYVHGVLLDGEAVFEDNGFILLAGEERRIGFRPLPGRAADEVGEINVFWHGCKKRIKSIYTADNLCYNMDTCQVGK